MRYNVPYQSYDFLKTCTLALIINSPVKGLRVEHGVCQITEENRGITDSVKS